MHGELHPCAPLAAAATRLDRTIRRIYDSARDPTAWPMVLSEICVLSDARGALLVGRAGASGPLLLEQAFNVTAPYRARFSALAAVTPGMRALLAAPAGTVMADEELAAHADVSSLEAEFLYPQGFSRALYGVVDAGAGLIVLLRSEASAEFQVRDKAILRRLLPHIAQAIALRAAIEDAGHRASAMLALLDDLPLACLIVSGRGDIRAGNDAGRALLTAGRGLTVSGGRIAADSPRDAAEMRRAIEVTAQASAEDGASLSRRVLLKRAPEGKPLLLHLHQVQRATDEPGASGMGLVAIVAKGLEADPAAAVADFARAYGLTGREARLVQCLAEGCGLMEAAARLGVSRNTARTHMRHVYSKVDTHRQSDLMRLLARLGVT